MSLQVWLPLNGDLHNQGLNNIQFTNNEATVDTNGKIGKCYSFNGSSNFLKATHNFYNNKYSVCAWIYSTSSTATQTICCDRTAVGSGFSIFLISGKIRIDSGGNNLMWSTGYTYPINTWFHLAVTYDGTNTSYYINGEFKAKQAQTISSSYWGNTTSIGASQSNNSSYGNYLSGKLNDIRIYNHCLSTKEVEEISKGLVLHYKLDKQYTSTPSKNLFIGSGFTSADYTDMTTSNSDTSNWSKYLRWYNGSKAIHSFSDGADTIKLNNTGNLGIAFVRKATDIDLDPDSYYTISCEAKCTKSGAQLGIGTSYYTTANAWVWRGGANKFNFTSVNTWQTFTYTFKPDSNTQYICYCITCANGVSGGTDTFSIRHCQLEKGSTATDWVLNNADIDYKSNDVDDCSGYNNNGTIIGSLTTETSSPRYAVYTHFSATTAKIHIIDFLTSGFDNSYSFAWWGKRNANNTMFWGFLDGIRLNGMFNGNLWNTGDSSSNPLYKIGTTTQVATPSLNQWHHYVMTGDGTKCYVYLDGELWAEAKTYKAISGTSIYINGWDKTTSYSSNNMDISDFRIYATALTPQQVQELYNVSTTIDNKGNIHARELVEE